VKEYFISLDSSKAFNDSILENLDYNSIKDIQAKNKINQTIDITKLIGHSEHGKISDGLYSWQDILLNKLKSQTVFYLINICVKHNKLYHDIDTYYLKFIKFNDKYYFDGTDGLHRSTLAKYILSHSKDKFLEGVMLMDYDL